MRAPNGAARSLAVGAIFLSGLARSSPMATPAQPVQLPSITKPLCGTEQEVGEQTAHRQADVPKSWGTFRSASLGLAPLFVFEDAFGNVRVLDVETCKTMVSIRRR